MSETIAGLRGQKLLYGTGGSCQQQIESEKNTSIILSFRIKQIIYWYIQLESSTFR